MSQKPKSGNVLIVSMSKALGNKIITRFSSENINRALVTPAIVVAKSNRAIGGAEFFVEAVDNKDRRGQHAKSPARKKCAK